MTFEALVLLLLIGLFAIIAGGFATLYHKLSLAIDRLSKQSTHDADNVITQTEALLSLYAELSPRYGFPQTRGWAASPDFLRTVSRAVAQERPAVVLECSSGISTIVLALSLRKQGSGKVHSLEHDPAFAEKTRALIALHGLEDWATVIDAPLRDCELPGWKGAWYSTENIPTGLLADLLVIDGPPFDTCALARYPALPILSRRLRPNASIFLDDADRPDERRMVARWQDELRELERIPYLAAEKGIAGFRVRSSVDSPLGAIS